MNFFEGEHSHNSPSTSETASHNSGESASLGAANAIAVLSASAGSAQSREKKEKMMVRVSSNTHAGFYNSVVNHGLVPDNRITILLLRCDCTSY